MFQTATESLVESASTCPAGRSSKPIFLDMDASAWGTWDGRIKLGSTDEGLVAEFLNTGLYKYLYCTLTGPINFQGAIFSVTLCFDDAAASSSHKVVFFNSLGDPWVNGDRVTEQSEAGADVVYNCTGFTQVAAPGQKFKIGLVFSASEGSVVIKEASLLLA